MTLLPTPPLAHSLAGVSVPAKDVPADAGNAIVGEIHESAVPAHAAAALDSLYGSMYASLRHLALCENDRPVPHTWIGYRHGEIVAVLLFRLRGAQAIVLTEMMDLAPDVAAAVGEAVFARFAAVRQIMFNAVSLPRPLAGLPVQSFAFSENYIIDLPASLDDYLSALGKSTRKTLRGYGNRLQRELPGLRWELRSGTEMRRDEQRRLVRQLQRFKEASMAARGRRAIHHRRDTARLLMLAGDCGMYGIASVDGRIVGGSLACRFGDNYVMLLSAADPAFESNRLGTLCCFWSIADCIRAGARQCHLLWGRYQYKEQLLGVPHALHRVLLYRSRAKMLLSPWSMLRMVVLAAHHAGRQRLLETAASPGWAGSLVRGIARLRGLLRSTGARRIGD